MLFDNNTGYSQNDSKRFSNPKEKLMQLIWSSDQLLHWISTLLNNNKSKGNKNNIKLALDPCQICKDLQYLFCFLNSLLFSFSQTCTHISETLESFSDRAHPICRPLVIKAVESIWYQLNPWWIHTYFLFKNVFHLYIKPGTKINTVQRHRDQKHQLLLSLIRGRVCKDNYLLYIEQSFLCMTSHCTSVSEHYCPLRFKLQVKE